MARSMTAFANAEHNSALGQLRFELRAVNHRFLELSLKLPEELRSLEPHLRERTQKLVQRGKVDVSLRYKAGASQGGLSLNKPLVDALLALADDLHNRHPELKPITTSDVASCASAHW